MKRNVFFGVSIACLLIGLAIFQWGHGFVRGYGGDVVVVVFLYALVGITTNWKPSIKALSVGLIAVVVELLQLVLHAPSNTLAQLAVGSSFDPLDFVAYTVGAVIGLLIDKATQQTKQ